MRIAYALALLLLAWPVGDVAAQDPAPGEAAEARLWLDRGDEPLLQRGDRVRIYYRTSQDAFVAIFQVDTDGSVRLLHPRAPGDETFTRGGRDYRLLFPQSSYWYVDEYPGKGYFFMVASPEPFDLSAFDYVGHERSWDLTRVGRAVYEDPYLAMDDYIARLIPDWEVVPYALDFIAYDVGEVHEYPRFLCYDCHGFRSYPTWNPYTYACSTYRVVVWDDPYFYPVYRYQGARVVYAGPRRGVGRYEFKERAQGESWSPLVVTRQPPLRRSAEYTDPSSARPPVGEGAVPRRPAGATGGSSPGASPRPPIGSPSLGRPPARRTTPSTGTDGVVPAPRPGGTGATTGVEPRRATPSATPTPGTATPRAGSDRPVLQRRPSGASPSRPSGGTTARPSSGGATVRPPSGSGGVSSSPSRMPTRSSPPAARAPSRSSSGSSAARPRAVTPPRSSGTSSSRPAVRPPARAPSSARPSSGSRPATSRPTKPPPRRKPGGGEG